MTLSQKEIIIELHRQGKTIDEIMDKINWREIKKRCGCRNKADVKDWIKLFIGCL
jgi:hypothetical protein